ncbi:hypothetical protein EVB97_020 [Rhizobium phage RHph_Y65]|uniref:Uncharacterized protein n=1 Tax=Rhizobium phage RHph_Y65 TaxID=2509785 RepID=A0A7S5UYQ3_9CAUD|nr:hypothetical protein PQC17_gp020 [Rhizobium phage RHph_Y65]QIG72578.1 hypothetical protein EVB97_020 [Rhizobium phage RHph_Y65]
MTQHKSEGDQLEEAIAEYFTQKRQGTEFDTKNPFKKEIQFEKKTKTICIAEDVAHRGGMTIWYDEDQMIPNIRQLSIREIENLEKSLGARLFVSSQEHADAVIRPNLDKCRRYLSVMLHPNKAMEYLGQLLLYLQDLHPDDHCRAYEDALSFYNHHNPYQRVEPTGLGFTRLVQPSLLGDDSESR